MTSPATFPLDPELTALRAEIRMAAQRLRDVTRTLRVPPEPRPKLRLLRGGLWPAQR
jgi:hypothetical protein